MRRGARRRHVYRFVKCTISLGPLRILLTICFYTMWSSKSPLHLRDWYFPAAPRIPFQSDSEIAIDSTAERSGISSLLFKDESRRARFEHFLNFIDSAAWMKWEWMKSEGSPMDPEIFRGTFVLLVLRSRRIPGGAEMAKGRTGALKTRRAIYCCFSLNEE